MIEGIIIGVDLAICAALLFYAGYLACMLNFSSFELHHILPKWKHHIDTAEKADNINYAIGHLEGVRETIQWYEEFDEWVKINWRERFNCKGLMRKENHDGQD